MNHAKNYVNRTNEDFIRMTAVKLGGLVRVFLKVATGDLLYVTDFPPLT